MRRKIRAIGNSKGVLIPVDVLTELDLKVGSEVDIKIDSRRPRIIIEPVRKDGEYPTMLDIDFVSQVNEFIEKYKPALKEIAKK